MPSIRVCDIVNDQRLRDYTYTEREEQHKLDGTGQVRSGADSYVIDADPRPGFQPHSKEAKYLAKIRGRVWIDKAESQWMKSDAEAIDSLSWGLFLARGHRGTQILVEQTRVNDEVWLPQQV